MNTGRKDLERQMAKDIRDIERQIKKDLMEKADELLSMSPFSPSPTPTPVNRRASMASIGSEVEKDLIQVLEGAGSELVHDVAVSSSSTTTTSSSQTFSVSHQPTIKPITKSNLFFKFGQAIADVAVSLVCCACNKGQQNISAQVESPVEPTQVISAPKTK